MEEEHRGFHLRDAREKIAAAKADGAPADLGKAGQQCGAASLASKGHPLNIPMEERKCRKCPATHWEEERFQPVVGMSLSA